MVAETRNFSRSAELLHSTQPAVSRRIQSLEDWLGARLFDRNSQPISLTPEGELFRPAAEEILRRLNRAREEVRTAHDRAPKILRFITTHSLATTFLPAWLRSVEDLTGVVAMRLETARLDDCVAAMIGGQSDFMLAYTHPATPLPLDAEGFKSTVIGRDRLVPVSAPDADGRPLHPIPGQAADRKSGYLAYTLSSGFGRMIDLSLHGREGALHLTRVFESHLAGVLKIMARQGRGLAWLAAQDAAPDIDAGTLVIAGTDDWTIDLDVRIFRNSSRISPAAEHFWKHVAGSTIR
ncbi:LysR family transcriptional regulator [Aliidongia dinghuensis]|uniref:LysR family transcriptional regulator n=2 Tax=Aliidongia dinghuensis TaxID=1867774 RepID=A0A8J2YYM9_9PROT|nr:LysR family transcriptional regulator [Aliidongia dinghuensis]